MRVNIIIYPLLSIEINMYFNKIIFLNKPECKNAYLPKRNLKPIPKLLRRFEFRLALAEKVFLF